MNHPAFKQTEHRPWPLPAAKWVGSQVWADLLFVHWEVDKDWLREKIPPQLELDLFDNKAWIGIVPFDMKRVARRGFPSPSWLCDFPEINVRTYVRFRNKPGVWFFSLDVPNPFAVWVARTFYHLPYYKADIRIQKQDQAYHYCHSRNDLQFEATYQPLEKANIHKESFEWWATERYCLYTQNKKGTLYRAQIHHPQWPLEKAQLTIHRNTLLKGIPVESQNPTALFSKQIDVVIYPMERLSSLPEGQTQP